MVSGPLADDHAVVVGISRYPRFVAEGVAENLRGPDHDALAVHDWLVDPQGGRLPPANVTLIRSADWAGAAEDEPQPASYRVQRALEALEERTRKRSGRRLYLYFSGHGFAPDLEEAAVYTAEASHRSPAHVYAHSWLRWFRKAQRFAESVLWVDACMNYQQSILAQEVTLREQVGQAVPGPAFIGVAAQTKSALELGMADGNVHGVFTWTLLLGLRGGAADERGRVTGRSLQDFLHNAMAEFLPPEVKQAASVDLQPFVRADEGLDFVRLDGVPEFAVTLRVPSARPGQHLRVWTGSPPRPVVDHALDGGDWHGALVRGLYVADVPGADLRQGFQVTGTGTVDVTVAEPGPPGRAVRGNRRFRLDFRADNPAASVVLIDHDFQRLYTETGRLVEDEVPGVYKVRTQFGKDLTTACEQIVLLDRPFEAGADAPGPMLTSAAPLRNSGATDAAHTRLFGMPGDDPDGKGAATLSIMSRYWTDPGSGNEVSGLPHPMTGLQLLTGEGSFLADLADGTEVVADDDPAAVWQRRLDPGAYTLRQTLSLGVFEGTVVVSPRWVTQIVVRRTTGLGGTFGFTSVPADVRGGTGPPSTLGALAPDDVAVFMRRSGAAIVPERDEVVEAARVALGQGRDLFAVGRGHDLRKALLEEFDDPIAGILGAHLLLRSVDGRRAARRELGPQLDRVVQRLRELVGDPHPDVEALSLRCSDDVRAVRPFSAPPVFVESWRLLVAASYRDPSLVPAAVWDRIQANTSLGPLLVWAADDQRRADHLHQLREWIDACRGPVPDEIGEAARRRGIPAAATAALWGSNAHRPS